MAEEEKTPKGNINTEYNVASTGMNMDQTASQIPKGKLTYALNANVENFDANSINYQNESGNQFTLTFPDGYINIGNYFVNEANLHIFFLANPVTGKSQIGYMENNDRVYKIKTSSDCLNFDVHHPIHKVVHRISNCVLEIYWTDGFNPRRFMDWNKPPLKLKEGSNLCDPVYTEELDCNAIKVQSNFSIPAINVVGAVSGGNNTAGTVQFAIQYSDPAGNPFTSYYSVTNPTPIADPDFVSVNFNFPVGKSIVLDITDLDTSGHFQYFNLAVIKTINDIESTELVGTFFIDGPSQQITYTGQNVANIRLSINDIFEKTPYYDVAQDLTAVQDVLVWDQLSSISRINYQSIWTKVHLQWETYRIPPEENYANEANATNLRGYLRDEVYALEGVFLLSNGKQTDGFHIPGRIIGANELTFPNVPDTNPDFIGNADPITHNAPYWKIYNTASVIGFSPEYKPDVDYKGPYQYGEFAYWESAYEYPCNIDVWGDLVGQKIRHHKFPDVLVSPINESSAFTSVDGLIMENTAVFPIGIKVDVQQIKDLIAQSDLTQEQKDEIVGFKIVRGNRGTNKSIIAKGMLRNVNKYTRDKTDYYYANYPYNDLSDDVFINKNNNAYLSVCKSFTVNITTLVVDKNGGPSYAKIQYTDCNTNKQTFATYNGLITVSVCSTTVPIFLEGNGGIGASTYDVWTIGSNGLCVGWRAQWVDNADVIHTEWVNGFPENQFEGDREKIIKKGTTVTAIDGTGDHCGIVNHYLRTVTDPVAGTCDTEIPIPGIEKDNNLGYRQIFNSPETSFGQPFLGDVLKIENVMYGAGIAHFAEVEKNAKYKLISKEAQTDALNSAHNMVAKGGDPFNVGAFFAAYQAYLTIYINGINRKNYAYSFNSIASYNYNVRVPNNLGIKQRKIDIAKYLIPNVISTGDNLSINNYNRETSVYIKTNEVNDYGSLDPLPFPNDSQQMALLGVEDHSRFTISEKGNCSIPQTEEKIQVVSYYASIKNSITNQWGQIYSYETIDTGYQVNFNSPNPQPRIVFGGDTFISRFAYKVKLPFFTDNRVLAPDDSDIFYDEIGNVGFPKYWHSSRSILEDYSNNDVGVLTNFISYKAHNFDCPNSQDLPTSNPDRTFYDGYFYLFAYGIPSFYVETAYNVDLRQAFNNKEGDFFPHVGTGIPDRWLQEWNVSILNDNTYYYNITYSKQNKENFFSHLPPDWEDKLCFTEYPFRAIYSDALNTDADNRVNNWRIYRAVSYFDFPQNYGRLISLEGIQNRAILARFENKSLLYNSLLTIDTSNPQAAYIGNPNMFKGAPPIDYAETDLGYVGCQNKMFLKTPHGQITADAKRGQMFLLQGTQAQDLTAYGSGMNRFFTDHLAFEILRHFPDVNTDNHFYSIGLHGVFDSKYERVLITKLDYIPLNPNIIYDPEEQEFFLKNNVDGVEILTKVELNDPDYFCNKSWTVSFNFNTKSWISFHSYLPNFYIGENNFFYSGINECCNEFDALVGILIPTPTTTTTTSTTTSSTTTTTTTIAPIGCFFGATAQETLCNMAGTAVITVPPAPIPCKRPDNAITMYLYTGYDIIAPPSTVDSTGSQADACNALNYIISLDNDYSNTTVIFLQCECVAIAVNNEVYAYNGTDDCETVPDGWYFTNETIFSTQVFQVVGGVINNIISCI